MIFPCVYINICSIIIIIIVMLPTLRGTLLLQMLVCTREQQQLN